MGPCTQDPESSTGQKTPANFSAAIIGKVHRQGCAILDSIIDSPAQFFEEEFKEIRTQIAESKKPPQDSLVPDLERDLRLAATEYKKRTEKWFVEYTKLPLLVFEVGGDDGPVFASAFLHHMMGDIKANNDQRHTITKVYESHNSNPDTTTMLRYFTNCLEKSESRQALGLVVDIQSDAQLLNHLLRFATGTYSLHCPTTRLLYDWTCRHVYMVMTDQTRGEGVFNIYDLHTQRNMSMGVAEATVMLGLRGPKSLRFIPDDAMRAATNKSIRDRPRDFASMQYMARHCPQRVNPPARKKRKTNKGSGKACKDTCICIAPKYGLYITCI